MYFGDGLYGAEAASRGYFGKRASELTIAEVALLAGLLQAPSAYAPTVNLEKAQARRSVVLQAMVDTKAITATDYERSTRAPIQVRDGLRRHEANGAYFKEEVRRQLVQQFGWERLSEGGLQIFTTIDMAKQRAAEAAIAQSLRAIDRTPVRARPPRRAASAEPNAQSGDALQAALVAIDPETGAVRALVDGISSKARTTGQRRLTASPGRRSSHSSTRPLLRPGTARTTRSIAWTSPCNLLRPPGVPMTSTYQSPR